jgi:hypothetical protein
MIINSTPQNEAVLSNVGAVGEFKIRNSAKAFKILSDGLYANKIRAIIRELSCNAVDSHVAAGKADVPFEVHLPTTLEPWFSIRDFGTGLDHDQVTNIYTTYFESTKTNSNDFIGALGLGSKSPFSYTDNFTVTAIKDGRKGIYTAFINEHGVPSIALMSETTTDETSGVEVKFAVNNSYDFRKFTDEASYVYSWFNLQPTITAPTSFAIQSVPYTEQNIIPGVHTRSSTSSIAVMGNIPYTIDMPNAEQNLGPLYSMLHCGLVMEFKIGELDFQASREGLSYVAQTIDAIKSKLQQISDSLAVIIKQRAEEIPNLWDRAIFVHGKIRESLWSAAAMDYASKAKLPTLLYSPTMHACRPESYVLYVEDLAAKYNIRMSVLYMAQNGRIIRTNVGTERLLGPTAQQRLYWTIPVDSSSVFISNDTKVGSSERVKAHYRRRPTKSRNFYLLEKSDREKPMDLNGFFASIHNPPSDRHVAVSTLDEKVRAQRIERNVTILSLQQRNDRGWYERDSDMVWREAGDVSTFDDNQIYYYIPLSGFKMISSRGYDDTNDLYREVTAFPGLLTAGSVYGVRKSDIKTIEAKKNWINIEHYVEQYIQTVDHNSLIKRLVKGTLAGTGDSAWIKLAERVNKYITPKSPFAIATSKYVGIQPIDDNRRQIFSLVRRFAPAWNINPDQELAEARKTIRSVVDQYPLLCHLSSDIPATDIAEYINLLDQKRGI